MNSENKLIWKKFLHEHVEIPIGEILGKYQIDWFLKEESKIDDQESMIHPHKKTSIWLNLHMINPFTKERTTVSVLDCTMNTYFEKVKSEFNLSYSLEERSEELLYDKEPETKIKSLIAQKLIDMIGIVSSKHSFLSD